MDSAYRPLLPLDFLAGFPLLDKLPAIDKTPFLFFLAISSQEQAHPLVLVVGLVCDRVGKFNSGVNIRVLIMTAHFNHIIHIYVVTNNKTGTYFCVCVSSTLFLNCF